MNSVLFNSYVNIAPSQTIEADKLVVGRQLTDSTNDRCVDLLHPVCVLSMYFKCVCVCVCACVFSTDKTTRSQRLPQVKGYHHLYSIKPS